MKILLCSLNSQYIHSSLAPWCLVAGLREYGRQDWQTGVLEGTVNQSSEDVAEQIITQQPDVVGFSCYIWNILRVHEVISLVKRGLENCTVVVGGPEVGYCPERVLRDHPEIDYVLTGEGEWSFAELCRCIEQKERPDLPGVTLRHNGGFVTYPPKELDCPPSPYTQEYFSALQGRIAYLETSRGCPYSCAYCLSARCGKLKFYPIERAKDELVKLANSGTKTVKLVDRTFNAHRERSKELFRFLIENTGKLFPSHVCFHFEIAGDLLDDETLNLLAGAPAGLFQLEIGIQSFHSETLTYIRRKTDLDRLCQGVKRLLAPANIHVHVDLIAGLPLEDFSTFMESVNRAYELDAHMLQVGFLKLLHGSPMEDDPHRYPGQFCETPPYEVEQTPWLTARDLNRLKKLEWAVDKLYNSGRFRSSLTYLLGQTGWQPAQLFLYLGEQAQVPAGASLDLVAQQLFILGADMPGVDKGVLRDVMTVDYLTHVKGGKLPAFLQVKDRRLKDLVKQLRKEPETAPRSGVQRGVALLYHPLQGVYVDYDTAQPITGEYTPYYVPLKKNQVS